MEYKLKQKVICPLCKCDKVALSNSKIRDSVDQKEHVYCCGNCEIQFLYPYRDVTELENYYNEQYRISYTDEKYYDPKHIREFYLK